jgi:uncharacterized membrane protein YphA (DoxX/SURF4 family)
MSKDMLRSAGYWTATVLVALAFVSGGVVNLLHVPEAAQGITELGYPEYLLTILGTWKVLGGLVILAPRLPLLKEWAYAGIAFDLTGAAFSHAAVGHPVAKVLVPLVILGIAAASYFLRPLSRKLALR